MPQKSKLINSGGQGCVFSPKIPCKNKKQWRNKRKKIIIDTGKWFRASTK